MKTEEVHKEVGVKSMEINMDSQSVELRELEDEWNAINWRKIKRDVFKIQKRIYRAEAEENYREVRSLCRLLLNDNRALLLSIRVVTQQNSGRRTAGLDNERILTNAERMQLFYELQNYNIKLHKALPARRIYIPKKSGKLRPLGIPTIRDRIYQNICKLVLEPICETYFEATSYGFRPIRGVSDAIAKIHQNLKWLNRPYVFEGDFKSCFDTLNHEHILNQLGNFPLKNVIRDWLDSGYVYDYQFHETETGTPQGGIISPLLANIALHGMEEALNIKYTFEKKKDGTYNYRNRSKYVFVRYADDFVILCKTKEDAEEVPKLLKDYLNERGLTLAEDKTRITHIRDGFDFLGFTIRSFVTREGEKLIIKPSKDSIRSFQQKVNQLFIKGRNGDFDSLIRSLNYLIVGTANYWRICNAKTTFQKMDFYIINKVSKLLRRQYPKKSRKWIKRKHYLSDFNGKSKDKYLFSNPETGAQLRRMSWTKIRYAFCIRHKATPYNKDDKEYISKIKFRTPLVCLFG